MEKEQKFFRQGSTVWTITRQNMTLDELARSGILDDVEDEDGIFSQEKEFRERFVKGNLVNGMYDYFKDHFSAIETRILLERIVDEIIKNWEDMHYAQDARPAMEKLRDFLDAELKKTSAEKDVLQMLKHLPTDSEIRKKFGI